MSQHERPILKAKPGVFGQWEEKSAGCRRITEGKRCLYFPASRAQNPGMPLSSQRTSKSKIRWLHAELDRWEREGLADPEITARLRERYPLPRDAAGRSIAQVILATFGALLVACGFILLLAHNWENLPRPARAFLSLSCLAAGHFAAVWTLLRRPASVAWREASGAALAMAVAACIALISQTYHLPGDLESFLLVWGFLLLPLPYLLRSGFSFFVLHVVLTIWTLHAEPAAETVLIYGMALALSLPYLLVVSGTRQGLLLRWTMALAACVTLGGTVPGSIPGSWILLYGTLFSLFSLSNRRGTSFAHERWWQTPFAVVGDVGFFVLAIILTFSDAWPGSHWQPISRAEGPWDIAIIAALGLGSVGFLVGYRRRDALFIVRAIALALVFVGYIFALRGEPWTAAMLMNLLVLILGAAHMRAGYRLGRMSLFNFGFLQVSALLLLRFFDADLGMLPRAGIFIVLGVAFLLINTLLSRRMRTATGQDDTSPESTIDPVPSRGRAILDRIGEVLGAWTRLRKALPILLGVTLFAHYAVPAKMMLERELTLRFGEAFRFETAPVDPYDPFRGRYVALAFSVANVSAEVVDKDLPSGETFATIETDDRGYARIASLHRNPPPEGNYLAVDAFRMHNGTYRVSLPFDRYYMNELAAPEAERQYAAETRRREAEGEEGKGDYALVRVREGMGVIEGLYLNGGPIEEAVRSDRAR